MIPDFWGMAKKLIKDRYKKELLKIGTRIQKIRLSKELSQKRLSVYSEVPYANISNIEQGRVNPTISTLIALAEALEVDVKELL